MEQTTQKMEKAFCILEDGLKTIRTGMANSALLEQIQIEYYGSLTPVTQVASIKVVEGRQFVIKPYDASILKDIERSISTSDTGLVPQSDGEVIRLNVPSLTEERRKELAKQASKMGEDAKIAIRNVRRDANDEIKKDKELNEDSKKDAQTKVQRLTDDFVKKIDGAVDGKTKEIMNV